MKQTKSASKYAYNSKILSLVWILQQYHNVREAKSTIHNWNSLNIWIHNLLFMITIGIWAKFIFLYCHIRSAVSTFSGFFFGVGPGWPILGPAGCLFGPFSPPNKLFAILCFALSSGATNFFFSFYFGGSTKTTGDLTSLASILFTGLLSFFSSFLNNILLTLWGNFRRHLPAWSSWSNLAPW